MIKKHIPNILTIGRLFLTIIFLIMILYSPNVSQSKQTIFWDAAFALFIISAVTDVLDGWTARRFNVVSKFGRMLDPLVDKILVCGTFICFAIIAQPKLFGFSDSVLAVILWSTAIILIAREAYVTILRHTAEAKGINFAATASGKIKMFLQSIAIGTVLLKMAHFEEALWGDWFTAIIYSAMLIVTVYSGLRASKRKPQQSD